MMQDIINELRNKFLGTGIQNESDVYFLQEEIKGFLYKKLIENYKLNGWDWSSLGFNVSINVKEADILIDPINLFSFMLLCGEYKPARLLHGKHEYETEKGKYYREGWRWMFKSKDIKVNVSQ